MSGLRLSSADRRGAFHDGRRRVLPAGLVLLIAGLSGFAVPAPAGAAGCDRTKPLAPQGAESLNSWDLASNGKTLAVSDSNRVWRSIDAGCSWTLLIDLEEDVRALRPTAVKERVASLAVTAKTVHALVESVRGSALSGSRLMSWRAESGSWHDPLQPPPPLSDGSGSGCGEDGCVLVRGRAEVPSLYLVAGAATNGTTLWASNDDGRSFSPMVDGSQRSSALGRPEPVPGTTGDVYAVAACTRMQKWSAAERRWRTLDTPSTAGLSVVGQSAASDTVVAMFHFQQGATCHGGTIRGAITSTDGGRTFKHNDWNDKGLGPFRSMSLDRSGKVLAVIHGDGRVAQIEGNVFKTVPVSVGIKGSRDVRMVESADRQVAMLTDAGVLFIELTDTKKISNEFEVNPCDEIDIEAKSVDGSIEANDSRITMQPGQTRKREFSAAIDGSVIPVDLSIVFDSSGSMGPAINSLGRSIDDAARVLVNRGYDANFALAEFSDLSVRPYRRLVPMAPFSCDLVHALNAIYPYGGVEPHLIALHQAVTGSGWPGLRIVPGTGGEFRPGANRLVLHVTDEEIDRSLRPGPSFEETVAAFLEKDVRHVGIRVLDDTELAAGQGFDNVRADLDAMGRATNSFAVTGLDCDSNGTIDVQAGEPITCSYGGAEAGVVRVTQIGELLVQIVEASVKPFVAQIKASAPDGIDVKINKSELVLPPGSALSVDDVVTIECAEPAVGHVRLDLQLVGADVATQLIPIRCGELAVVADPPRIAAAPPPPPPLVPSFVSAAHAAPSSSSNAFSGAMAPSAQKERSLAYQRQEIKTQPGLILTAGAAMSLAAAAARRKRQEQLAIEEQRES